MKLKIKSINGILFKKNLYLMLFIFFFIFSGGNAPLARAAECTGPADVVLAIDRSANMAGGTKFETVKSSSVNFIDNLFSTPPYDSFYPYNYHQIGLAIFNNNITSEALTTNYAYIQNVISSLGVPDSSCKAGEAVQKAQANLNANGNIKATKTIIILIAGPPDNLAFAIDQVRIAKESGTRVISVGINLDKIVDPQRKANAENFISNVNIPFYDCYYAPDDPDATLDGCTSISTSDLNNSLNTVYADITGAVCDEIAPTLEISRIPSGALYSIDKLIITSIATDDIGFKSHSIVWSSDNLVTQTKITNCSLIGKIISCDTGLIGPFAVGKTINFGSSATDANDNVITIDPLNNAVKVATVSLTVPPLLRNKSNEIKVNISDYSGADNFYIRVDNGAISRIIDENNASSKMTCSGTGSVRDCLYYFNPGCASEGVYTDPSNAVDIYIYAVSSGITRTSYISSKPNNILGVSSEGIAWGNCGNGIDDDCDGLTDSEETVSCDGISPVIAISRTPSGDVYDDNSITFTSTAADPNGIKQHIIYYKKEGDVSWTTAFNCLDAAPIDGKCDGTTQSVTAISATVGPFSAGKKIYYYSQAIDYSGNNNTGSTLQTVNFVVKSRECEGVSNLGACNVTLGGKCCGGVCDSAISNPGSYNTSYCAKEICNGTSWEWGIDISKNNTICSESGNTDGCYPYLPTGYFWDGGCEERAYRCSSGLCAYGAVNRNSDYCIGGGSLILNDYECVSESCALSPNPAVENNICDVTIDSLSVNAYNSDDVLIAGSSGVISGEALDNKTNQISLISSVSDINGISEHRIYWRVNSGAWSNKNCGTCPSGNTCDCDKDIGPYNIGDVVNFYAWAKDNSPNKTERATATYSFTVRDSDCYNIPGGNKANLTLCGPGSLTNGKCCAGSCDTSVSSTSFDAECRVDACSGTNWVYAAGNESNPCGAAGTCFSYYTGCINGNKCASGYCSPDLAGKRVDLCAGNLFDNYGCASGSCGLISGGLNCSLVGNSDGDSVACNCDCNGYDREEKVYSSLKFDGKDDYINLNNFIFPTDQNSFSAGAWIKTTSPSIMNVFGGYYAAYYMSIYNNKVAWYDGNWRYSTTIVNDGKWHHIFYILDNTSHYSIYVDGNREYYGLVSGSYSYAKNIKSIGKYYSSDIRYFNGSMDEVRIYNRALYPEEVKDHYNGIFTDNSGLVGYWNFNEGTGETANDSSGNGNNGSFSNVDAVLYNGALLDSAGKYGKGIKFDGSNDYVKINGNAPLSSSAYTVALWIKPNLQSEYWKGIIGKNGRNYNIWLGNANVLNGGFIHHRFHDSSSTNSGCPNTAVGLIRTDGWNYVVITNNGITCKTYINDGAADSSGSVVGSLIADNGTTYMGSNLDSGAGNYYKGMMDEVRFYNRALSDIEVQNLYRAVYTDNSGLVGYWNFNEGSGTIAYDSSENGPQWVKYHHDSASGINGNVPINWQVCADGKDNDCDSVTDEYEAGNSQCDGEVDSVFIEATAVDRNNVKQALNKPTANIYDADVSQASNDFTLSATSGDDFGIYQTRIEWTTDNWGTENYKNCDYTGVCKACVIGGTCGDEYDIINLSSLMADTVFTYRACAWDNNNNKICSSDYSFVVLNSNSAPYLTDLGVIIPNFCEKGLEYILSWKFNDDDILDKQSYYEAQVKEGSDDFTTGPFVVDVLKYVSADNPGFSYHPIINGENLEYGEKEYYWRVRATDSKLGGYAKTSEWIEGDLFITPAYKFPRVEFSANLDIDPGKDCLPKGCNFGEDIVFHDDTVFFVSCNSSNNKQCLNTDAAKCDVGEGQCVSCSGNSECFKFDSLPNINYSCVAGICEGSGSCVDDNDCKSADYAKCDVGSGQCVACDDNLQCEQFILESEYYICNAGKCEFPSHRTWDFYGYGVIGSADPNPINNYVESVYDDYDVILKITDITGKYCSRSENIKLGGELYPEWNEVLPFN